MAVARIRESYSWDHLSDQYETVFKKVLGID